jgi:hypothetical protein
MSLGKGEVEMSLKRAAQTSYRLSFSVDTLLYITRSFPSHINYFLFIYLFLFYVCLFLIFVSSNFFVVPSFVISLLDVLIILSLLFPFICLLGYSLPIYFLLLFKFAPLSLISVWPFF